MSSEALALGLQEQVGGTGRQRVDDRDELGSLRPVAELDGGLHCRDERLLDLLRAEAEMRMRRQRVLCRDERLVEVSARQVESGEA